MPSAWRDLALRSPSECGVDAAFATFVSGDKYVPGAVCLRRSMLAAGNRCPMDLIYDDRVAQRNLSAVAWQTLAHAYGPSHLFSLSQIMAQHPQSALEMEYSAPQIRARHGGRQHNSLIGRGLFERGVEHMATHSKLWLFGMPRKRLVVLDSDMVVLGPLDWTTTLTLPPGHIAAMGFGRKSRVQATTPRYFNSGLMVIQPATADLHNLTRLALQARQGDVPAPAGGNASGIVRAGEKIFGDQSILNHYFRSRWTKLPDGMIGVAPAKVGIDASRILAADPAVVHWLSEPKPWSVHSLGRVHVASQKSVHGTMTSQGALWWRLCSAHVGEVPHGMMG